LYFVLSHHKVVYLSELRPRISFDLNDGKKLRLFTYGVCISKQTNTARNPSRPHPKQGVEVTFGGQTP